MTCEQIRESVDAVNVSEMATQHLKACNTCRKEVASTAKLVGLLNAQPQVKAPVDFMARLQMRMATEAVNEDARLKSLLQAVPAVTAPPDFAFRVRAGLAREKAQKTASNPLVWLQNWFAQSFSFGQAATAMAAVALIAMFTTMQLRQSVAPTQPEAAPMVASNLNGAASTEVFAPSLPKNVAARPRAGLMPRTIAATPVKAVEVARVLPVAESAEPAMYSPKAKQVVRQSQAYFGRELEKVVTAQRADNTIAAF